jgi:hypothetical protein
MMWATALIAGVLFYQLFKYLRAPQNAEHLNQPPQPLEPVQEIAPQKDNPFWTEDPRLRRVLCLAYPMAHTPWGDAWPTERAELEAEIKPTLFHLFGLHTDMTPQERNSSLQTKLHQRWFAIDLDQLKPQDNPQDAMAFACVRVAFAVRMAHLLGWIDEDTQWQVLLHNAQRTQDCFEGWADYANAWRRGRKQWVVAMRADSLGASVDEAKITAWLTEPQHPWSHLPWIGGKSS